MSVRTPPELSYVPASGRWYSRPRGRRTIIGVTLVAVIVWFAFHAEGIRGRAIGAWLLWKENRRISQCMSYAPVHDGHVVWDSLSDPNQLSALLAADQRLLRTKDADGSAAVCRTDPECFDEFGDRLDLVAGVLKGRVVLYLHEVQWPEQHEKVLLALEYRAVHSGHPPHIAAIVIVPGGLHHWPVQCGPFTVLEDTPLLRSRKRIEAGQVDPNDPSSVTVRVTTGEGVSQIRLKLKNAPQAAWPPYGIEVTVEPRAPSP